MAAMSLIAPTPGTCFGTVVRDGLSYPCPRPVIWHGTLKTTRNGLCWEADACEHHGRKLMDRYRVGMTEVVRSGPQRS